MFHLGDYVRVQYRVSTSYDYTKGYISYFDETWLELDNKISFPINTIIFVKKLDEEIDYSDKL